MKILNDPLFSSHPREFKIAEAVEMSLSHTDSEGEIERIREQLNAQANAIALLVEQVASGVRELERKRFVGAFLAYRFKIED